MSLKEEFLKFLSNNGLSFSPCMFNDEGKIPPREEWQSFIDGWNRMFEATKIVDDEDLDGF